MVTQRCGKRLREMLRQFVFDGCRWYWFYATFLQQRFIGTTQHQNKENEGAYRSRAEKSPRGGGMIFLTWHFGLCETWDKSNARCFSNAIELYVKGYTVRQGVLSIAVNIFRVFRALPAPNTIIKFEEFDYSLHATKGDDWKIWQGVLAALPGWRALLTFWNTPRLSLRLLACELPKAWFGALPASHACRVVRQHWCESSRTDDVKMDNRHIREFCFYEEGRYSFAFRQCLV